MKDMFIIKTITTKNSTKEIKLAKLNASEGIIIGTKLLKLILPVLGGFADGMMSEEEIENPKTFSEMASRIVDQMDSFDSLSLIKKLFNGLAVDGQGVEFDSYFMANYGELVLILEIALKENFQSFFEGTGLKTRLMTALGVVMTDDQAESDEQ